MRIRMQELKCRFKQNYSDHWKQLYLWRPGLLSGLWQDAHLLCPAGSAEGQHGLLWGDSDGAAGLAPPRHAHRALRLCGALWRLPAPRHIIPQTGQLKKTSNKKMLGQKKCMLNFAIFYCRHFTCKFLCFTFSTSFSVFSFWKRKSLIWFPSTGRFLWLSPWLFLFFFSFPPVVLFSCHIKFAPILDPDPGPDLDPDPLFTQAFYQFGENIFLQFMLWKNIFLKTI